MVQGLTTAPLSQQRRHNFHHSPETGEIYGYLRLKLASILELVAVFLPLCLGCEGVGVM